MAQSSPKFVEPATNKKGPDAGHGNRFQSKLLIFYAMRAINAGYQFYLGTELEDVGGKFDDLIFKYKDKNDATTGRYHYLQAKHKLNENDQKQQIKENHLLCTGKDNNFDLKKYFQSYVKIKSRGEDIEHCIICTNVDFDQSDLKKNDIILLGVKKSNWPKMLDCAIYKPQQAFYKFKVNNKLNNHLGIDPLLVNEFFDKIIFSVNTPNEDELDLILGKEVGKHFQLSNNVLPTAYIMNTLVNWFKKQDKDHQWLTPEKAKEIINGKPGELMVLSHTTFISIDYQQKLGSVGVQEKSFWKSPQEKKIEFNNEFVDQLNKGLKSFWKNTQEKIKHINSKSPKLTAVKVISAIQKLSDFTNIDDYLVLSSTCLKTNKTYLDISMKVEICHRLLIVVDEDANPRLNVDCENLIPTEREKKIILISNQNFNGDLYNDLITYEHLSKKTKEILGQKQVSFQGTNFPVIELIDLSKADKELDPQLIENLLHMADDEIIEISSFTSSNFQESLYIKRQVVFPSPDELIKKLARKQEMLVKNLMDECKVDSNGRIQCHVQDNEELWKNMAISIKEKNMSKSSLLDSLEKIIKDKCQVDSNGRIQWFAKDKKEKEELWKDIAIILIENNVSDCLLLNTLSEERLIDTNDKKRIIIRGVAGTGKSTILSHYYKEIKKKYSDWWVITINLVDHISALRKIDSKGNAKNFFINATGIDQNPFARLLLKHRLEMGDRIVIMLDGFDEIDTECQNKVVQLVKNLNERIPLYITTRPHIAYELQFELSQLAYSLNKFTEDDQIKFMTSIWKAYLIRVGVDYKEVTIRSFAKKLIERVAETLNDKEKEFIGIPLQCRILAESFLSKIITVEPVDDFSHLLEGQQFDLVNLYKMMFKEKRRVYCEEKIKVKSDDNHIAIESIEKSINKTELYLRKLAIQTIVEEQEYVDILIPSTSFKSEEARKEKEEKLNESGIRFGFLNKHDENRIQFLHRTYAEYLLADYIYNGFLLDEKCHNKLLENESVRKWIIEEMFEKYQYNGIRVFFDSMLKEILNDEEWRNRIKQRNLPDRLKKFASLLCDQREKYNRALRVAFWGRNANILLFIFYCLDVQITPSDIRIAIDINITDPFHQRNDVFQRILNYFNDADHEQLEKTQNSNTEIQKFLCRWRPTALELKQENVKRNVGHFLDFMLDSRHREKVKFGLDYVNSIRDPTFVIPPPSKPYENHVRHDDMRICLIHHGDDDLIKKYFTLVSLVYSDNWKLTNFMKEIIHEYHRREDWQIGQIEKTLITLRDNGRINVAAELSRLVLVKCSEIFQQDENINIRSSLEVMGMTGLYWAAYRGDLESIEKEIEKEKESRSLENPETYSGKLLRLMLNDNTLERNESEDEREGIRVAPFEVAAAYGHEMICQKILKFVQGMNDDDTKKSLIDAIFYYKNVVIIRTILKSVTAVWGQNALIDLLKPVFGDYRFNFRTSVKKIYETMFCVVVEEDEENGYRDLNELVFQNEYSIRKLKHVPCDILQGIIDEEGGFDHWIKRLMETCYQLAFKVLISDRFLDKFDQMHLIPKLIDTLIKLRSSKWGTTSSYWLDKAKWEKSRSENFIKVVAKRCGEDDLKKLLFIRDENNMVVVFRFLIRRDRYCLGFDWLESILSKLPGKVKKEVEDFWKEETPQLIDHLISSSTYLATLNPWELLNAIEFYLKNGNDEQLSKFSQVVDVQKLEITLQFVAEHRGRERCIELVQLFKSKLDSNNVTIYNSLIEKYSKEFKDAACTVL